MLGPLVQNALAFNPVLPKYGTTWFDRITSSHDHMDDSKQMRKAWEFKLTDGLGNSTDLQGLPRSLA